MKGKILIVASMLLMGLMGSEMKAELHMSPLFTDNMVLQQKTEAPVWGTAAPGVEVSVYTSWNKAVYTTVADQKGEWSVKVKTPKAGGPYTVKVTENGSEPVVLDNVLIGEVWLCSGQSNMEMPVKGWGKVMNYEQELKDAAKYTKIRFLEVQRAVSPVPETEFKADADGWMVCSPETLEEFSSTAYFFGRELHLKKNVPVGLINSSWGGTIIEAWMSRESLTGVKDLEDEAAWVATWPADKEARQGASDASLENWNNLIAAFDRAYVDLDKDIYKCEYDDSSWATLEFPGVIEQVYPDLNGHVFVRKEITVPQAWEGKTIKMHIEAVDDKDCTYFNGTLVAEGDGWAVERVYEIPAHLVKAGKATVAMRIMDTAAGGGINGEPETFYLEGPDGDRVSLAGTWKAKKLADYSVLPQRPLDMQSDPNWTNLLYNTMINPLVPYSIKGAIWYQGCSNEERAYQYRDLMTLMIEDWRKAWGYEFPFYITQLASFMDYQTVPCESSWAELREAQSLAARVTANTGIAVTIDIGDAKDIHPKNKQEVGRRLALQALNKTYGMPVECSGPVYEGHEVSGNVIKIRFSSVGKGLVAKDGKLEGFAVAGADRKFYWADAKIVGDCVELTCKDVERPLAVRYAWANNPVGNLFNAAGLPASPFRTDDWQGLTVGKTVRDR